MVELAALWSLDPSRLEDQDHPVGLGLAARLPNGAAAYVDYAHTPDALRTVLAAARPRYSLLDKGGTERLLGVRAAHWRVALRETLAGLAPAGLQR